jgi:hypothetical protein
MTLYMKNRRADRYTKLIILAGGKCIKCGSTVDLEFDHRVATEKLFSISDAKCLDGPMDRILRELEKCDLLCHPCHREKTILNKETGGGYNKIEYPQHGTSVMFNRLKCRCDKCSKWKSLYRKGIVDARGEILNEKLYKTLRFVRKNNKAIHGSASMYEYHKCNCDVCKAGNARRAKERRNLLALDKESPVD